MRSPLLLALVSLCLLAGCGGRVPEPEPTPTPTPTATPTPEPTPTPVTEAGDPITVELDYVEPQLLDNAVLRGQDQREPSPGTLEGAAAAAASALERYLTAQFIDPETWFGPHAIEALLGPESAGDLDEEQRRGLGELALSPQSTEGSPVVAQAVVQTDGDDLLSVTLVYSVEVHLRNADGSADELRQEGRVYFPVQDGDQWQAEMVELTLTAPGEETS